MAEKSAVLETMRKRFQAAADAEREWRAVARKDYCFGARGEQWDKAIAWARDQADRPALVHDITRQTVLQVVNEYRQSRQAMLVAPVDDRSDPDLAQAVQEILRGIEYDSDAQQAYDLAMFNVTQIGKAYVRLKKAYMRPDSFEQKLAIEAIPDTFSVYMDPGAQKPAGEDAEYVFVVSDLSGEAFAAQFPHSERERLHLTEMWTSAEHEVPDWVARDGQGVRIADYYCREWQAQTLYAVQDPMTGQVMEVMQSAPPPEGVMILQKRETQTCVVKHYQVAANEILAETTWPGGPQGYLPVVRAVGFLSHQDGRVDYSGIVRPMRDPARMYNFWVSAATEMVGAAVKAKYVGWKGQFTDSKWDQLNDPLTQYLEVEPVVGPDGQLLSPPTPVTYEAPIQTIMQCLHQARADIDDVSSVFQSRRGQQGNETSARAIDRRNQQSQTGTFHFSDGVHHMQRVLGRVALPAIAATYDTARVVQGIAEDNTPTQVAVNQPTQNAKGESVMLDLSKADAHDIIMDAGADHATKRQEFVNAATEIIRANPTETGVWGDLYFGSMDFPGARQIAARKKKAIQMQSPGLIDDAGPNPQVQQLQQQVQQLQGQLQAATDQQALEVAKLRIEREKIETDRMKIQADMAIEDMKMGHKESLQATQMMVDAALQADTALAVGPSPGGTNGRQ